MSDPRNRVVHAADVVRLLNEAAAIDPKAILALVNARVPCNEALLNHPTIQAGRGPEGKPEVGLLGILNGLFGTYDDGWGCIAAELSDEGAPIRFNSLGRWRNWRDS